MKTPKVICIYLFFIHYNNLSFVKTASVLEILEMSVV